MDDARRSKLLGIKLTALIAEHLATSIEGEPEPIPGGVATVHDSAAWILIDGPAERSLGAVLAWSVRRSATSVHLITESGGGVAARRAQVFALPISVWFAQDRLLLPVVAEPLAAPRTVRAEHAELAAMIEAAGAVPLVEHGVLVGEVRGLEVCRVVDQPTTGFFADQVDGDLPSPPPGLQLEVGVGPADREAFQLMHGDLPTLEALTGVVRAVSAVRRDDAPQHPLNRLGRERFLRWKAEQNPSSIGLFTVEPAEPPMPRANLKDPTPCVAAGRRTDGTAVRVVFSSGVDLDLIPFVADVQLAHGEPVVVVVPRRDLVPLTSDLAALLVQPIELVPIEVTTVS